MEQLCSDVTNHIFAPVFPVRTLTTNHLVAFLVFTDMASEYYNHLGGEGVHMQAAGDW
jgi:hypothetical protein